MHNNSYNKEHILLEYLEKADYFKSINDYKSAIEYYEKFLEIDNSKSVVYTITADLYSKLNGSDSLERQIELYEQAYKLQPGNRLVLHGLAFGYEKSGNNIKAKTFYEKLLQNNPTENDYYNYGAFLIHCGDFTNGHRFFARRFNIDDINLKYPADISRKWNFKSDISNKTLLVHYEQGFGDTIMYSRFVPFLKRIAKKVIFVVQEELYDLISGSEIFHDIEVKTKNDELIYDVNMALLDVPLVISFPSDNLPHTSQYLDISDNKVEQYKKEFLNETSSFKIGISCSGENSANYNDRNIDISKVYDILKNFANAQIYNLQKENKPYKNIIQLGANFENFSDSACAVKNMDLIISTDNVILNLAGALGVRTLGLFNKETNYRWFKTEGENVGWYKSVQPLQAHRQNSWDNVLFELKNMLRDSY